jgi:hypothetical protein
MVAIIPVEMHGRLIAEREARFQVLDRIRGRLPGVPLEETGRGGIRKGRTRRPGFVIFSNKWLCLLGRFLV